MKNTTKFRIIVALVIIVITSIGTYNFFADRNVIVEPIASGIVTEKTQYKYRCGKHDRYECTDYGLVINNTNVIVSKPTFDGAVVNQNISLTRSYEEQLSVFDIITMMAAVIIYLVLAALVLTYIGFTINWAINYSDKETLSDFAKRTGMK